MVKNLVVVKTSKPRAGSGPRQTLKGDGVEIPEGLFNDLGNPAGSDGPSAFADRETLADFHGG